VTAVRAHARYLGGRIAARALSGHEPAAAAPQTFLGRRGGYYVLMRFGSFVGIGTDPGEDASVLDALRADLAASGVVPAERGEGEEVAEIRLDPAAVEGVLPDGGIVLRALDPGRAHVVGNVLAKSAVLAHYEDRVAEIFDRVEALAGQLRDATWPASSQELLAQIGDTLLIRARMVGRVEVGEKPAITWDEPELDRLYERLALEFELADRDRALTRKLEVISDVAGTYLELIDTRKSLRLEWYIVILIVAEIVFFVAWELFRA